MIRRSRPAWAAYGALAISMAGFAGCAGSRRLPGPGVEPPVAQDLAPPHNLQGRPVGKSVVLSWSWMPSADLPPFFEFGFDVERKDGRRWTLAETSLKDFEVEYGTYAYRVRVRARAEERGRKVTHLSRWAGPLEVELPAVCPAPPEVDLDVKANRQRFNGPPSLRVRLSGRVRQPAECGPARAVYAIDSGTGLVSASALALDASGAFDEFVDVLQPGDEIASGALRFVATVTAQNEAGSGTSAPVTLSLQLENPYAPRDPF